MKPEPVDAVQAELFAKLEERAKEGALQRTWRAWSLGAHLSEWLLLATAPGGDVEKTKTDPVLSEARTPRLYEVYIEMLFIGLSDKHHARELRVALQDLCALQHGRDDDGQPLPVPLGARG